MEARLDKLEQDYKELKDQLADVYNYLPTYCKGFQYPPKLRRAELFDGPVKSYKNDDEIESFLDFFRLVNEEFPTFKQNFAEILRFHKKFLDHSETTDCFFQFSVPCFDQRNLALVADDGILLYQNELKKAIVKYKTRRNQI